MSSALVTGVTGQDGFYLAQRLLSEAVQVFGLVKPGDTEAVNLSLEMPGIEIVEADLSDSASVTSAVVEIAPDEVFHLAGLSSVALSWERPVLTGQITGLDTVAVMHAALPARADVRLVFASSAEVFGGTTGGVIDESAVISPATTYGGQRHTHT